MSYETELVLHLPAEDPAAEALERIASAWGVPVTREADGGPRVQSEGLLVYSVDPDEEDKALVRRLFDLDSNLTLVFVDLNHTSTEKMIQGWRNTMKIMLLLAAVKGSRAVYVEDYNPSAIILRFEAGQLTLNQDWDGWERWPEVLEVIPHPHRLEPLKGHA